MSSPAARPASRPGGTIPCRNAQPSRLCNAGTPLLQQQFWLWGQDIRRPDGNLLLQHGFVKERPPAGEDGSRTYTLELGDGRSLVLWGFGLFHGDPQCGGLYLARASLAPRLMDTCVPPSGIWLPDQVPRHRRPAGNQAWATAWQLVATVLAWAAAYERWIRASVGASYRAARLAGWPRRVGNAAELATRWDEIATQARLLSSGLLASESSIKGERRIRDFDSDTGAKFPRR